MSCYTLLLYKYKGIKILLINQYWDKSKEKKNERKRAIIACESCRKQKDVAYGYYTDCIIANRKYCKTCSEKHRTLKLMEECNLNQPLSKCLSIEYVNGKPKGNFECSKCGSIRTRNHGSKPYTQLCSSCSKLGIGQKHEVRYDTRLARIYRNMKDRCYNKNQNSYKYYGAKGVTICDEWLDDRTKFYDWSLANGYTDLMEIDKDKKCMELNISPAIYSPETCIWITRDENATYHTPQTNTGLHGISLQKNGEYRLRSTHQYPQDKDSQMFKTLEQAVIARSSSGK